MGTAIIIAIVLAAAGLVGCFYQIVAALLLRRFARAPEPVPADRPGISLLKPLHGDEPGLEDALRQLPSLDYPALQILCNTLDRADPAQDIARSVRAAFPKADMSVHTGVGSAALNLKVASIENMLPHAKHEIIALADADVIATPRYLDNLAAALEQPGVGLVTCLYIARPTASLWSRLEALWINHSFLPSVLVARAVGRTDGCFGATIALRRATLERAGGMAPLRDLLADDFALGAAVRRLGLGIAIAARPVDMIVHQPRFAGMFRHELRWGRTIAGLDRPGFAGLILTQPVILGLLAALVGGFSWPLVAVFGIATVVRLAAVRIEERALGLGPASVGLLAFREILTFAVFVAALLGRTVHWRGLRYRVHRDGTMQPMAPVHPVKESAQ